MITDRSMEKHRGKEPIQWMENNGNKNQEQNLEPFPKPRREREQ